MSDRLSDSARRALSLAHAEARRLGHGHVGTEHLLLGILAEGDNGAAAALNRAGVTLHGSRDKVDEAVGETSPPGLRSAEGELPLTDRARRSLDRAGKLSLRLRAPAVETEHILSSVLQVEGRAGQVIRGLGVDPSRVRTALESPDPDEAPPTVEAEPEPAAVDAEPQQAPERARPSVGPACSSCGARLEQTLAHRGIASRGEAGELRAFVVLYCATCGSAIGSANV